MTSTVLAMLVIIWPGHDIQPQSIDKAECERAVSAVQTAVHISDKLYTQRSDVSAYCIPLDTAADQTVYALLARPNSFDGASP